METDAEALTLAITDTAHASQVYLGTYRCTPCAVKRVPRLKVCKSALDEMMNEIRMMSRLHHPNIVQLLGCCFDPYVCLVLELAARGSLRALLESEGAAFLFKWTEHARLALGMARGLSYLHSFEPPIIHRDIKPANVSATRAHARDNGPHAASDADPRRGGPRGQAGRLWRVEGPGR